MGLDLQPRTVLSFTSLLAVGAVLCFLDYPERGFAFKAIDEEPSSGDGATPAYPLVELSQAVSILQDQYAFQSRLEPRLMLMGALQGIAEQLDYVLLDPPFDPEPALALAAAPPPESVTLTVRGKSRSFDIASVKDLYHMTWKLMEVFDALAPSQQEAGEMEEAAIVGLLSVLDPHTNYLTEEEYKEMKMSTQGSFGGLGIVISVRKGKLTIVSVLPGTPAAREGLKKGDHIVQIDQESTVNMLVGDAANRMRGKPGTDVDIWILRGEDKEPRKYPLTREIIKVDSVVGKDLDGLVAYVRIKGFQQNTAEQVEAFLKKTSSTSPPEGIILDLRGNSGGVMSASVELADLFLPAGKIVTTVEKVREGTHAESGGDGEPYESCGLVVLTDHASASASEIVTGALKYRDRAVVIGQRTFGKGSVQYVNPLTRGGLKLTIAQYVGPEMEAIQSAGIEPHVALAAVSAKSSVRVPLYADDFQGEEGLPYHLQGTGAVTVWDPPIFHLRYVKEEPEEEEEKPDDDYDSVHVDFPIQLAWSILAWHPHPKASQMLEHAVELLADATEFQEDVLERVAAREGKDWTPGPVPDAPALAVTAAAEPPRLDAGAKGKLLVQAENRGNVMLPRLVARAEADGHALDRKTCIIGSLQPGEAGACEILFTPTPTSPARKDRVWVDVVTGMDDRLATAAAIVETVESPRPRLALNYTIDDSSGNGDNLIELGEKFDLLVEVVNLGRGKVTEGLVTAKNLSGPALFVSSGRFDLKELDGKGAAVTTRFSLEARAEPEGQEWLFELGAMDLEARRQLTAEQALPMVAGPEAPDPLEESLRLLETHVPVRIGPAESAPTFGTLVGGGGVKALAQMGGWYRVALPGHGIGWIPRAAAEPAAAETAAHFEATHVALEPRISVRGRVPSDLMGESATMVVAGTVDFGKGHAPSECGISLYLNGRKVKMLYFGDLETQTRPAPFRFDLELEQGVNRITLSAYQKNQSPGYLSLYYNRLN